MARAINPAGIRKNNTKITEADGVVSVQLHATVIARFNRAARTVVLDNGGWNTPTTLRRMNECLHFWGFRSRVTKSDFSGGNVVRIV